MQDAVKDGLQFSNFPMNIPYKEISEEEFYKKNWMNDMKGVVANIATALLQ
jgi:hypothetical protein